MKNYLRFKKGENPGELIPICTCFRSHLANEISCSNCGLKIPQGPTPEFAVRETIKSLKAAEQNKDGSVNIPKALKPYMNNKEMIGKKIIKSV